MRKLRLIFLFALTMLTLVSVASVSFAAQPVTVAENKITLNEGETSRISVTLTGKAEGVTPAYYSSDKRVATVDGDGVITAVSKGDASIYVRAKTASDTYSATVRVTVIRPVSEISVNEEKLSIFSSDSPLLSECTELTGSSPASGDSSFELKEIPESFLVLRKGQQLQLNVSVLPKDASVRSVTVTSSDDSIVRCSDKTLTGKSTGRATVTIASKQNPDIMKSYEVLVVKGAESVKVTSDTKSLFVGGTLQLSAIVGPEDASIKGVAWSVADGKAGTVDENGLVTGVARGTVTIRARAIDGSGRSGTIQLNVTQRPESITINDASNKAVGSDGIVVNMGSFRTVKAVVNPSTTGNKKVRWSSSNENIAKVSGEGRITPVSVGDAVITAISEVDPSVSSQVTVHVHQLVTKIKFMEKNLSIDVDTDGTSYCTIEPDNATDKRLIFSSSDKRIATVDENGIVHGIKRGEVTITAKAADSEKVRASYKVSVLQPVYGVSMKEMSIRVGMDETGTNKALLDPSNASNTRMTWVSDDPTIAKVSGKNTTAKVYGVRWGTTTITGTTEDGGFTTSFQANIGDLNKALEISDLYIKDGRIRIVVKNRSNMNIEQFSFTLTVFDKDGNPVSVNARGENVINGKYREPLEAETGTTRHNTFWYDCGREPEGIERVVMKITGYSTDDGYKRTIKESRQPTLEFCSAAYNPPEVPETPAP